MTPLLVLIGLAGALGIAAERRQQGLGLLGLQSGLRQLLGALPLVLLALWLAGMVEALVPQGFVRQWLSAEAGLRGVGLGVLGGSLLAMGPYAAYPVIASIQGAGAGMGTVISLLSAWALLSISKLPFEVGFLGPGFTARRVAVAIPYCLLAGAVAHLLETHLLP